MDDAARLALYTKKIGLAPEQVQDFYPTPGTASTVMYYTGLDPFTLKPIYTATDYREKQLQRALLQWRRPENRRKIYEAMNYCTEEGIGDLRELLGFARNPGDEKNAKKDDTPRTGGRGTKENNRSKNPRDTRANGRRGDAKQKDSREKGANYGSRSAKSAKGGRGKQNFDSGRKKGAKGGDNYKKKQR